MVQWLALLFHSKKSLGLNPGWSISVWSLHFVLAIALWIL